MHHRHRHRHRLLAAAGAAILMAGASASLALAQDRPPPGAERPSPDALRQRFEARHAQRTQALHDALQLRPEQEGPWREFQAALAPPPEGMRKRFDLSAQGPLTTPERLDLMSRLMAERQARFQKVSDATKRFYAVLTPQQQKAFDSMASRDDGLGRRGHGRGHERGGPPGR